MGSHVSVFFGTTNLWLFLIDIGVISLKHILQLFLE